MRGALARVARRAFATPAPARVAFAPLFALYAYIQPAGFRSAIRPRPTGSFAAGFADNLGLRLFYGEPHDLVSVGGYTAWRVGGTLAIAAAAFGLLAAVRALRTEEDTGRMEPCSRRRGAPDRVRRRARGDRCRRGGAVARRVRRVRRRRAAAGGSAFLALATASVIPVCAGVGAVAGQLAPTRRVALRLGGAVVGCSSCCA